MQRAKEQKKKKAQFIYTSVASFHIIHKTNLMQQKYFTEDTTMVNENTESIILFILVLPWSKICIVTQAQNLKETSKIFPKQN